MAQNINLELTLGTNVSNLELSLRRNVSRVVKKKLTWTDIGKNVRLYIPKNAFEQLIIPELPWELVENLVNGVEVMIKDERDIAYHVTLIKFIRSGDYYFKNNWIKIVKDKGYKINDEITFWWDSSTGNFYLMRCNHISTNAPDPIKTSQLSGPGESSTKMGGPLGKSFTSSWSEHIAEAARKGGNGEVELDWDSYERAKQEILSDKARTKEETKMRAAEEAAQAKTEKMKRVAERKNEHEERDQRERKIRKPKQKKDNATIASRSKLKKRLTKVKQNYFLHFFDKTRNSLDDCSTPLSICLPL
ncbi:hypothetical protein AALP_AA4G027700 [Arabis alpina]|uniref:TF-B3 domain-containing protein n=1 Tax=Arabis alpina TaxID=50452 RepID=A0A087H0R2_ARAAL|nr:hypothetical protein AALP_AA4G027700 [Arabis alpina]